MTGARPVLLLHGWGGTFESTFRATGWCAELERAGRRAIAVDLPGHGRGTHSCRAQDYADLAGAVACRLPCEALDVVGYSLGAKIAIELARRAPDRFGRIVLGGVGDNLFAPERSGEELALALERRRAENAPLAVQALMRYALASGNDPLALAAVLRRPANPVLSRSQLGVIGAPVLLINGDRDPIALPDESLRSALPQTGRVLLAGIDHLALPGEDQFRDLALAFLNETRRPMPDLSARRALGG